MLYFRVVPETGSYVLRVSNARGASGNGVGVEVEVEGASVEVLVGFGVRGLDFEFLDEGGEMVYLDVIRV